MTTLKDLLRDFQKESIEIAANATAPNIMEDIELELGSLLDEYMTTIKERLVG